MAVIKAKPTSPGRRGVISIKSDLYKGRPHKALLEKKSKNGGRNFGTCRKAEAKADW